MEISSLGFLREGLVGAATDRLEPSAALGGGGAPVTMSLGAAIAVIVLWAAVPLAAGAWRTQTRDA
jgi:hypothetical protein